MRNDETAEIAATTTLVAVCLNLATRRAMPFPEDFRGSVLARIEAGK
jgi:acyl-CoA thioesterase FadM